MGSSTTYWCESTAWERGKWGMQGDFAKRLQMHRGFQMGSWTICWSIYHLAPLVKV
jgi:hypothetical protein